ncbi:MAG: hypothetical protein H6636_03020 [Anaerolineales bacterium]|nr:hypothetical protein [Anaerolineales bacterium]
MSLFPTVGRKQPRLRIAWWVVAVFVVWRVYAPDPIFHHDQHLLQTRHRSDVHAPYHLSERPHPRRVKLILSITESAKSLTPATLGLFYELRDRDLRHDGAVHPDHFDGCVCVQ